MQLYGRSSHQVPRHSEFEQHKYVNSRRRCNMELNVSISLYIFISEYPDVCFRFHGKNTQVRFPFRIITEVDKCNSLCNSDVQCNSYSENTTHCFLSQCDSYEYKRACENCKSATKINITGAVPCSCSTEQTTPIAMIRNCVDNNFTTFNLTEITNPKLSTITKAADGTTSRSNETAAELDNNVNATEEHKTDATSSTNDSTTAQQDSDRNDTEINTSSAVTTLSSDILRVSEVKTTFPVERNTSMPSDNEAVSLSNTLGTTKVNGNTTWTHTFDTRTASLTMNEKVSDPTITQPINAVECVCVCKFTNQSVEDSIKIRKKELAVDKGSLTTAVRKLNSAKDIRKSSKAIGVLSVIVLITCGVLVICPDVFTCLNFLYKSILKKKKNKKGQVGHFHV